MKQIEMVTGPIDVERLGYTLMHDHLVTSGLGIPENYPMTLGGDIHDFILHYLKEAKQAGIDTVIDPTTFDLGRDVRFMKQMSQESGVNVGATTGCLREPNGVAFFFGHMKAADMAKLFIHDLTVGIAGTDSKACILKAGMDMNGRTPGKELVHRAIAIAHKETGAPICLHTCPQVETAREQLRILKEEGVDMNRVKVDHVLDCTNMDHIDWLIDQGVWLGVDRLPVYKVPGEYLPSTERRIKTIKSMLDAGYASRMLMSHDTSIRSLLPNSFPPYPDGSTVHNNPDMFLFLKRKVIPRLLEMGVAQETMDAIFTKNPVRFFSA